MNPKPFPNRARYLEILRSMSAEQKVGKVFELNNIGKELVRTGLRSKHPQMNEPERHALYLKTLEACHNRNY